LHATAEPRHSQFTCDDEDRSGISRSKMFFGMVCSVCIFLMPYSLSAMPANGLIRFTYPAYVYPAYLAVPMMHFVGQWPTDDHAFVSLANRRFTYRILLAAALTMQQLCDSLLRLVPLYCLIKTAFFAPIEANGAAPTCTPSSCVLLFQPRELTHIKCMPKTISSRLVVEATVQSAKSMAVISSGALRCASNLCYNL